MPAHDAHLAIDLGADSGRGIVVSLQSARVEAHEIHRFVHRTLALPSGLHWDIGGLFAHVLDAIRVARTWCDGRGARLVSVGVDSWGVDFALIDRAGELCSLPHAYRDPRNQPAYEAVLKQVGARALYQATGTQLLSLNTLFQLVAMREANPLLVDRADRLLFIADLVHYWLSGVAEIDETLASTSQMIDARNGRWCGELLSSLGIPTAMLRTPAQSGSVVGPLRAACAEPCGVEPETLVVRPASHDSASAVVAAPALGRSWCYISSGTWSVLGVERDTPCISDVACDAGFTNERGLGGTNRFLSNLPGLWLVQECRRHFAAHGADHDYGALLSLAAAATPFRTLVAPDDPSFVSPGGMPERIAAFARRTRQPEPATIGEYIRCCIESLALSYAAAIDRLERVAGEAIDTIHIVGGGSRNAMLNRMTADVTRRRVVAGPAEATALGNGLAQALALGRIADRHAIRRIVTDSVRPEEFVPQRAEEWDEPRRRFLALAAVTSRRAG